MKAAFIGAMALTMAMPVFATDMGVYAKGGTLGLGGGVGVGVTDSIRLRAGYTTYKYSKDKSESDVDYHGDMTVGGGEAMVDWHPFNGTFRLTGGLTFNRNKATLDAKPTGGTYTLNDVTYTAAEIGALDGNVSFQSTAPYFGVGWGDVVDKAGNFSFIADIGVLFQGSPDVKLNATCGTGVDAATCAEIQSNTAAEEKILSDDLSSLKYWPVISLGVAYRF